MEDKFERVIDLLLDEIEMSTTEGDTVALAAEGEALTRVVGSYSAYQTIRIQAEHLAADRKANAEAEAADVAKPELLN